MNSLEHPTKDYLNVFFRGSFLLGLSMGTSCNCSNRRDAVDWVKRNFGHHDFLVEAIDKAIENEKVYSGCGIQNSVFDNFCSNYSEKL